MSRLLRGRFTLLSEAQCHLYTAHLQCSEARQSQGHLRHLILHPTWLNFLSMAQGLGPASNVDIQLAWHNSLRTGWLQHLFFPILISLTEDFALYSCFQRLRLGPHNSLLKLCFLPRLPSSHLPPLPPQCRCYHHCGSESELCLLACIPRAGASYSLAHMYPP